VKISRDFAEKMALLPLKNERIAIKSLEILAPLFKSSNVTDIYKSSNDTDIYCTPSRWAFSQSQGSVTLYEDFDDLSTDSTRICLMKRDAAKQQSTDW
jgi:hypothetical protein